MGTGLECLMTALDGTRAPQRRITSGQAELDQARWGCQKDEMVKDSFLGNKATKLLKTNGKFWNKAKTKPKQTQNRRLEMAHLVENKQFNDCETNPIFQPKLLIVNDLTTGTNPIR
jgi:hypothetical protein